MEASSSSIERRLRRLEQMSIRTLAQEAQAKALQTALADRRCDRDKLISVRSDGEHGRRRPGRDRSCDSAESTFSRPTSSHCSSFRTATVTPTLPPYVPSVCPGVASGGVALSFLSSEFHHASCYYAQSDHWSGVQCLPFDLVLVHGGYHAQSDHWSGL